MAPYTHPLAQSNDDDDVFLSHQHGWSTLWTLRHWYLLKQLTLVLYNEKVPTFPNNSHHYCKHNVKTYLQAFFFLINYASTQLSDTSVWLKVCFTYIYWQSWQDLNIARREADSPKRSWLTFFIIKVYHNYWLSSSLKSIITISLWSVTGSFTENLHIVVFPLQKNKRDQNCTCVCLFVASKRQTSKHSYTFCKHPNTHTLFCSFIHCFVNIQTFKHCFVSLFFCFVFYHVIKKSSDWQKCNFMLKSCNQLSCDFFLICNKLKTTTTTMTKTVNSLEKDIGWPTRPSSRGVTVIAAVL